MRAPQGVASRDIKLENTLLDGSPRPLLKICDFGYSKARLRRRAAVLCATAVLARRRVRSTLRLTSLRLIRGPRARAQHEKFQSAPGSRVGTPAYLAPEVIMTTKGQTYDGKVGAAPAVPRRMRGQRAARGHLTGAAGAARGPVELRRHALRHAGRRVPL